MQQQEQKPQPPIWAELLLILATVAGNLVLIWSQLPPQERDNLRMAARLQCRSLARGLAGRAWRAGHAGMAEELAGRDPSAHYVAAAWLGRWRDRLEQS